MVSILSAQVIAQSSELSEEQVKFFYGEFFKEICSRAANADTTNKPTQEAMSELLRRMVDLLASELRMDTPNCLTLAGHMSKVFKPCAKFHKTLSQDKAATNDKTSTLNDNELDRAAIDLRDGRQGIHGLSEEE